MAAPTPPGPERWVAADVMRGLAVAGMLLVDYQGNVAAAYRHLKHATWNGWTFADLIFPAFVFLVGVSAVFSVSARLARGDARAAVLAHAVKRALILLALGIFLNGCFDFDPATWRIYGVIQRIALVYLAVVIAQLWLGRRGQVAALAVCLLGYWALLRWVPVPGLGLPGRDIPFLDPEKNLVAWIDRALLPGRLYEGVRDPEGLLSTLPAIATGLFGLLTASWTRTSRRGPEKTSAAIALAGAALVAVGLAWGTIFPINKNLWTSSYAVFSAGCAMLLLAALDGLIRLQVRGGRWTVPLLVFGTNALLGFFLDLTIYAPMRYLRIQRGDGQIESLRQLINGWLGQHLSPPQASLAYGALIVLLCWCLLYPLYRKRWLLKV